LTFLFLEVLLGLALLLLTTPFIPAGLEFFATSAVLLLTGGLGLVGFAPFRRAFETRLLAMPLPPEKLLSTYAARITTSLELETLRKLLLDEVMPSLLVRQFAQLEWRAEQLTPLFSLGVQPEPFAHADLERAAGHYLPVDRASALPGWVRLVLPLRAAGKLRGWWLLGQRDPDDRYSADEIALLQALADQTALALTNIDQSEALRALYFEDIERHEAERLHLAVELHDDVLNQLAALNLNLHSAAPEIQESYGLAVARIREIINGLRPAMLNYGLHTALEALADDLNDRHPDGPEIILEVPRPQGSERYPDRVELALFRVVQQACANAIQHAACKTIRIQGSLDAQSAALAVLDDGQGFVGAAALDLPALLAGKHFGLAGMYERAALVGATLTVQSQPGQGCRVAISWQA
jgi:signal transduction histidine kinase